MPNSAPTNPPMTDPRGPAVERLGQRPRQHPIPAGGRRRLDGRAGSAPEAEVGVRLPHRRLRQRASRRSHPAACSSAATTASSIRSTRDRLRLLVVREPARSSATRRPSARSPARAPRATPSIFGDGHANVYALDAQTGRQLWKTKADPHFVARITAGSKLYNGKLFVPGLVVRGVQQRQSGLLRAARRAAASWRSTRTPARRSGRPGSCPRSRKPWQDAGQRRGALQAGRRRGVEFADGRSGARRGLLRHRRRDDGAPAEDDRRDHGGRHQHRQAAVVVSGDRERRVHGRLQRRR